MKFNLDNVRKTGKAVKKGIFLGKIAVISLSSASEKKDTPVNDKNPNFNEVCKDNTNISTPIDFSSSNDNEQMNPEFYRLEYLKYMEHPSYKERLAREMYGDSIINEEQQNEVNAEYERRLIAIKNIHIEMMPNTQDPLQDSSYYSTSKKSIKATPRAINHELSHSLDHANNFMIKQNGFEGVVRKNLDESVLYFYYDYLSGKSEIKARLNSLRLKAIKMYGFDLGDDFDINNYEKLRDNKEYKDLRFNLQLTNEQINELMRYVAINENNKTNKNYYHPEWNYGDEENIA